jgi:heme-degrading monooxygenase HmoA
MRSKVSGKLLASKKSSMNTQESVLVSSKGPQFAVLYRWRLHEGAEESFVRAWTRVSELLLSERGSLGSRLHRGPDGLWYSYAQWPSAEAREQAFALESVDPEAGRQMAEAIAEGFPEIVLESVSDLMVLPSKNGA